MAAHLERHPKIRCVVNMVPVLLDQIDDYVRQFATGRFRDPLLRMLATPDLGAISQGERRLLLDTCFRSNHVTMLAPFPHYQSLHDLYQMLAAQGESAYRYLSRDYFSDLVTWYHLAWTGETERRRNPLIANLMSQGEGYAYDDRRQLLASIGELISGLIPRWKALADRGQIELSSTPQTHPLSPLLLDFRVARESIPDAPLPFAAAYPGGRTRVQAHIDAARASHARHFGAPPVGMWPAEGAVSEEFVKHLASADCRWIASGEGVLRNSLEASGISDARAAYHPVAHGAGAGADPVFPRRTAVRPDRLRLCQVARARRRPAPGQATRGNTRRGRARGAPGGQHHPRRRKRMGALPLQRILFFRRPLRFARGPSRYPHHHLCRTACARRATAARRAAPPHGRQLGLRHPVHLDRRRGEKPGLGLAVRSQAKLRPRPRQRPPDRRAGRRGGIPVGDLRKLRLVLVVRRLQPAAAVTSFDSLYRRNLERLYHLLHLEPPASLAHPICAGSESASGGSMRRVTAAQS
jgi:hypothetical protein